MIKLLIISLFLCALVPLWLCLLSSTNVEDSLQIHLFLQNEANFRKSQMNLNSFITMNYEQRTMNYEIKNEPKTNPIKANYRKTKNERNLFLTKNYEQ